VAGTAIDLVADIVRHHGRMRPDRVAIHFEGARLGYGEPGYKAPRSIDFVGALPCNPTGKIPKRELRKPCWEHRERQVH
jgi:hypothetical protein